MDDELKAFFDNKMANTRRNLDLTNLDGMTRQEISAHIANQLLKRRLDVMYDLHEVMFGVPCGPTLSMLRPDHEILHYVRMGNGRHKSDC